MKIASYDHAAETTRRHNYAVVLEMSRQNKIVAFFHSGKLLIGDVKDFGHIEDVIDIETLELMIDRECV